MPLSLPTRLYYHLKPCLPEELRLFMRRRWARHLQSRLPQHWPISESAATPPPNWPGWPNGRKFAFILTHDVEGQIGLDQCHALMSLEMKLGFRSSFNFVPEGEYTLSDALREKLTANGFEVGVHDLYHDGKLYRSRTRFHDAAQRINYYLNAWGATGFRSGFMHHNLEWLHDLDIAYDCSTFDTDPFEPQPDGVHTIFPFWVPTPGSTKNQEPRTKNGESHPGSMRGGFWELPYSLPQDYNTFIVMGHTSIELWKQKLDWIAAHGGMALIDAHPDYMDFSNESPSSEQYPVRFYRELLEYVREKYAGQYWHGTPMELVASLDACSLENAEPATHNDVPGATHQGVRTSRSQLLTPDSSSPTTNQESSSPARRPLRVCMVTHSIYETDNRVMRYAESLAKRGDVVEIFCLKQRQTDDNEMMINGVTIHRIQTRAGRSEQRSLDYLLPILRFCGRTSVRVLTNHLRCKYDFFHIHNVPDFVVFTALVPRCLGARVILDIHDIVPEFYASKFKTHDHAWVLRSLFWMEKLSSHVAHQVIISNHLWQEKYQRRTRTEGKCSVFINNVDADIFQPTRRTRTDDRFIVLFPGGFQWHQGLDIAIRAFQIIVKAIPRAELHLYGDGNMKSEWVDLTKQLGLSNTVKFFDGVPIKQIAAIMANADLGVVPKRSDSFGNEAYSTKIMEFMSVGIPVVISRTKIDQYYFNDQCVCFFESGNHEELAQKIIELARDPARRAAQAERALAYAQQNNWETRKNDYLGLVDSLCNG